MTGEKIVILTGAGISADSGVSTFRDKNGIWSQYDVSEVATPEGFAANPELVHEFYNMRRAALKDVEPNEAHFALAELEKGLAKRGSDVLLVTQNVDDLHERAGSSNLFHMHGELSKIRCGSCGVIRSWEGDLHIEDACSDCMSVGTLRPHVVWFGEMPLNMDEIERALSSADLFISIGTSGSVYPAAGFVNIARARSIQTIELNLEPSENREMFDQAVYGPARTVVPEWVGNYLG